MMEMMQVMQGIGDADAKKAQGRPFDGESSLPRWPSHAIRQYGQVKSAMVVARNHDTLTQVRLQAGLCRDSSDRQGYLIT